MPQHKAMSYVNISALFMKPGLGFDVWIITEKCINYKNVLTIT